MKIGIVTVYCSENSGSFLQAYALSQALKKQGHEVVFVHHSFPDHAASYKNYLIILAKTALKGMFTGLKRLKDRRAAFKQAIAEHLRTAKEYDDVDCFVLGSDVIWDLKKPFFSNHRKLFWGTQFEGKKVISYAASVGFAKEEDLDDDFVRTALDNMAYIAVRDIFTKNLLQPYTSKAMEIVCDPTYLLNREDFEAIAKPVDLEKFIFIYCYGKLLPAEKSEIQEFARKKGLKTVTYGNLNEWCDISLPYDPVQFLSLYAKADYIITNTFHGTVFATIYEKQFAVLKNDKPKVVDVLQMCSLSDKMTNVPEDIGTILESKFDYDTVRQKILSKREKGLQYLKSAIEG